MDTIIALVIGGIAGWLAGVIMKTKHGLLLNVVFGLVGGVVGNLIMGL